jgi:hypothetical protein
LLKGEEEEGRWRERRTGEEKRGGKKQTLLGMEKPAPWLWLIAHHLRIRHG